MARVQLIIPDDDWSQFVQQARMEGMSVSTWLLEAARVRLQDRQKASRFGTEGEIQEFFQTCDAIEGPDVEPDWSEHLREIDRSHAGRE